MDIVIPFQHSINRDEELRYALRSAEKYIANIQNVFIVGDTPVWTHDATLLHVIPSKNVSRSSEYKDNNIASKLFDAILDPRLNEIFVIMHDDNFLLAPFNPLTYWHKGNDWEAYGMYAEVVQNTLARFGNNINNYDVHAPHRVRKSAFITTVARELDWSVKYGYCIKTAYAVLNAIKGTQTTDCKINAYFDRQEIVNKIEDRPFFSIGDTAFKQEMIAVLKELYPNKSKYEK